MKSDETKQLEIEEITRELANSPLELEHYVIQSLTTHERANQLAVENARLRDFYVEVRRLIDEPIKTYEEFYNGIHTQIEILEGNFNNERK